LQWVVPFVEEEKKLPLQPHEGTNMVKEDTWSNQSFAD